MVHPSTRHRNPPPFRPHPWLGKRLQRLGRQLLLAWFCWLLLASPVQLAIAQVLWPQPDGILMLGGEPHREAFTAYFASTRRHLPIWISSGQGEDEAMPLFTQMGISAQQVTFDYRAVDTVTNFTTLVSDLQTHNIHHLYLITSDYHLNRASAIAFIILGSHRIAFTPIGIPTRMPPEASWRIGRDVARSWLWLTTGWTGAQFREVQLAETQTLTR